MSIPYPKFASLKSAGTPFVSPQRAFAWAMRSLALAALAVAPCARALDIYHLDPAVHMRFSSGNYAEGNLKENPRFLLAGHDLSGLGWSPGGSGVTLISLQHFVTASHMGLQPGTIVSFFNRDGVIKHYVVESNYWVEHTPGVRTDLILGRLTAPIPPEDHVGYFPTLRLPHDTGYTGIKVFSFGLYQACGHATIARSGNYDLLPFNVHDHVADDFMFIMEWHRVPGEAQAQGSDSGSPTFMVYQGKLALIGSHSAVEVSRDPYVTADVLIPAYFTQINARLALDGFAFGNSFSPLSADKSAASR